MESFTQYLFKTIGSIWGEILYVDYIYGILCANRLWKKFLKIYIQCDKILLTESCVQNI